MKTNLIAAAALCLTLLPAVSHAESVYTYSEVQIFTESTPDWALGVAIMDVGYGTPMYYDMGFWVNLAKMNEPYAWDNRYYHIENTTWCSGSAYLDYDPTAEYQTEFFPNMIPHFENQDGASVDYYNYGTYLDGVPVLWPGGSGVYEFYGFGPETFSEGGSIPIGTLSAVFSNGSPHGPPDHVKVLDDDTSDFCNSSKERVIKFQIVASDGRRAARSNIEEQYINNQNGFIIPFAWNSCRSENVSPTPCAPDDGARPS